MFADSCALIIVDVQNDFLHGGSLAVRDGDAVIGPINRLMEIFPTVVATQDWHPADHGSFAANHPGHQVGEPIDLFGLPQILWPVHCVQGTPGARLSDRLDLHRIRHVVRKGTDPRIDSYSGFYDNGYRRVTGLSEYLKDVGVNEVFVAGLATDYCVKHTALDAVQMGFKTTVIEDACRGVQLHPGDVAGAIEEIRRHGVEVLSSGTLF